MLLVVAAAVPCFQETIAGVRVASESATSIELEYRGTERFVPRGRIIESSANSALVEVGDLGPLKLEILAGILLNEKPKGDAEIDVAGGKGAAVISFQGVYRSKQVALIRFFPEERGGQSARLKVKLSWEPDSGPLLSRGSGERNASNKRQVSVKKRSSDIGDSQHSYPLQPNVTFVASTRHPPAVESDFPMVELFEAQGRECLGVEG